MHRPAIQRHHLRRCAQVAGRVEAMQVAQQEARGVADAAIGVGVALEDLLGQRHLVAVVGGRDPQAQDVGAKRLHDVLRLDAVAQRLRHLAAVLVHGESMGQALPVRRRLVDGDAGQQRGLEPAAMLVRALQVQVRRLAQPARQQHRLVGDAGIEPDVEDVGDAVVLRGLVAEQFGGIQRVPSIHAGALHAVGHLVHQRHAARMRLAGLAVHEQRDRHAPGALSRDGPVRAAFDHAGDAGFAPLRIPRHALDRGQRIAAQVRLVHRDEPLRGGAERDRGLVPPAVRVAVGELREREQATAGAQHVDQHVVGLPHVQAGQLDAPCRRCRRQVDAASVDRVQLRGGIAADQAVLLRYREVFLAVAGRGMHGAGAVLGRHVVAEQDRDVALVVERMREQHALQRVAGGAAEHDHRVHAVALQRLLRQRLGQHQPTARTIALGRTLHQHVVQRRAHRDRQRRRQGPRRGGPDRHRDLDAFRQLAAERAADLLRVARGIGHVDRGRHLVLVLDLRLGQRAAAVEAPVHRLHPAQQVAVLDHLRQRADLVGLELEVQRAVRIVPVAEHAQPLEVAALHVDLLGRVFAALLPERGGIQLGPDLAPLLLDRDLDRQAVAVPARDVGRIEAGHRLRLDDDVLEDLVDRMAKVDRAVGVRRTVVQHEARAPGAVGAQLRVEAFRLPARQRLGLALGQVAAHRERGLRQQDGGLVRILLLVAHAEARCGAWSMRMARARSSSRRICATIVARSGNFSSSRRWATNSTSMRRP